jgi:hypothetical protein
MCIRYLKIRGDVRRGGGRRRPRAPRPSSCYAGYVRERRRESEAGGPPRLYSCCVFVCIVVVVAPRAALCAAAMTTGRHKEPARGCSHPRPAGRRGLPPQMGHSAATARPLQRGHAAPCTGVGAAAVVGCSCSPATATPVQFGRV